MFNTFSQEFCSSDLDSMVFIEIPCVELKNPHDYRVWYLNQEKRWLNEFNNNPPRHIENIFNEDFSQSGISGRFGETFIICKFARYDGTRSPNGVDDYRAKRGVVIRNHYSLNAFIDVYSVANNLIAFLEQEKIVYNKIAFKRKV